MYKKVSPSMDFAAREQEVLAFWRENEIFKKSNELRKDAPPYTFYDGPPTANGLPHIGHILTRCIKDLIPRYKTMKGYSVLRKAGWDTHGLPVELEVERQLGLDGKKQIEDYGVEPFIEQCKQSVWKYKADWEKMSERVGFFADMEHPYVTYENDYIESVWWSLKQIADKGLLYKGHKVVPYCPRCGTALSSHEVAQGYRDVIDTTVIVKFAIKGELPGGDKGAYFLAWTTTPWTLPSNVALCVNKGEEYGLYEHNGEKYVLACALAASVLGEDAKLLRTFKGAELVGIEYEPLFPYAKDSVSKKAWFVTEDSFVTLSDGTGIVHMAPAFGEDDARVARTFDLPFVQLVDERGEFTGGTPYDGLFVKQADPKIIEALEKSGQLLSSAPHEHSYPFCWRCDTPLIYYARSSWFIKMTAVKDKLIEFNRRVNWLPESIKEGRMGNFLENVIDWGLSRERYWGTPLPVWVCNDCGATRVIGSIEELRKFGRDVPEDIELHKPFIDKIELGCECGCAMKREDAVIDCWYDSGSMPFAQWHYPFENKELFEKRYPANFISEAIDQTRGWFYTLLAISTCLFDEPAFENCIVLGHVQDKNGQKMSKHKGNVVDPWQVLDKQGADAVRWYFYTASSPWLPSRFYEDAVSESERKFMGTLYNTYAFYVLYANIDGFDPTKHKLEPDALSVMDRWILSRLESTIALVDAQLDTLHITEAARALSGLVDELSNWYVRRCRERYWGSEMTADKQAAYMTLYTVLERLIRTIAPFTPFITEDIYQNIVRRVDASAPLSVHLAQFPQADESYIDQELERHMDEVLNIVVLGRAARNVAAVKNRQPLGVMYVQGAALPELYVDIIRDELNVKKVEFVSDASAFIAYKVKPQLKTLGPRYGSILPKINAYLQGDGIGNAVVAAHAVGTNYDFTLDAVQVSLSIEDVLVETAEKEGFVSQSERSLLVVMDTNLTEQLVDEGFMRELVSKVQTMRKEAGFEVTDHIRVTFEGGEKIASIFEGFKETIMADTLADEIVCASAAGYTKQWDINGQNVKLGVEKK